MMFGGGSSDVTVGVAGADGDAQKPVDRAENRRRWLAIAGATVGVTGFAAGMTTLYKGARSVEAQGGFCASGGPYQIAHQCTSGETAQLFVGIGMILVFGAIYVGLTAYADGPVLVPSGLLWTALFGSLGAGFVILPKGEGSDGSNLFVGIMFLVMAAAGLWPAISQGYDWIKRGGAPEHDDSFDAVPFVKAAVAPQTGVPGVTTGTVHAGPTVPSRLVIPPKDVV
jgi:hypothetical protein